MTAQGIIYLDHAATTPLDPCVLDAMMPFLTEDFGNSASRHHALGRRAHEAVEKARERVAALLGADPREIVWTSGATESNNLALKGLFASEAYATKRHLVTSRTEHAAVLDVARELEARGIDATFLSVDAAGLVDLSELRSALREDTLVVSIMEANNETGVLQELDSIGRLCRDAGVLVHTDAAQSLGKEEIDLRKDPIDLLSFSGHKIYGPKGVGGLFVRRRDPRVRVAPLLHGGGHERGVRSGTLNVPGIVGLAKALEISVADRTVEMNRLQRLRGALETRLLAEITGTRVNGQDAPRLSGICSVSFTGIDAEQLIAHLPELAVSTASACTTASRDPSHVLGAMGLSDELIGGSLRLSLGRKTTGDEVDRAAALIRDAVALLRASGGGPQCVG